MRSLGNTSGISAGPSSWHRASPLGSAVAAFAGGPVGHFRQPMPPAPARAAVSACSPSFLACGASLAWLLASVLCRGLLSELPGALAPCCTASSGGKGLRRLFFLRLLPACSLSPALWSFRGSVVRPLYGFAHARPGVPQGSRGVNGDILVDFRLSFVLYVCARSS